jgi:hypothetical protein
MYLLTYFLKQPLQKPTAMHAGPGAEAPPRPRRIGAPTCVQAVQLQAWPV